MDGNLATIESIAVHPDHQHRGIGTMLFEEARLRAAALGATTIDAWTRDDDATLGWYRARGFRESDHYQHVYADHYTNAAEPAEAVERRPSLEPIKEALDHEAEMRKKFRRVHICRRFAQPIGDDPPPAFPSSRRIRSRGEWCPKSETADQANSALRRLIIEWTTQLQPAT